MDRTRQRKAIVLLSGGIDSTTTLYVAKKRGYRCHCLIFDYGQRHKREIRSAARIARLTNSDFEVLRIKLPWGGSSLLEKGEKIPAGRMKRHVIPSTYVPGRNIIFLSFSLSFAESVGAEAVFIGANVLDYSGYPDCRPSFLRAFERMAKRGTKEGATGGRISIEAPLLRKTKREIIELGCKLKVPYKLTWSCYRGLKRPCGSCDACLLREKGFREAGLEDQVIR